MVVQMCAQAMMATKYHRSQPIQAANFCAAINSKSFISEKSNQSGEKIAPIAAINNANE